MLDNDFFEVLDSVTIARSRKQIETHYDISSIGKFPKKNPPISKRPKLTDIDYAITYNEIFERLFSLNLSIYTPTHYLLESRVSKYAEFVDNKMKAFAYGRELGIRRLTAINLMKRLESSVHSFRLTLNRIAELISNTLNVVKNYEKSSVSSKLNLYDATNIGVDFDLDDLEQTQNNIFTVGNKIQIDIMDMDYIKWKENLISDLETLHLLISMVDDITPKHDTKLQELISVIENKINNPINKGNKKIIVFTAFSDTASYIYDNVSIFVKEKFGLNTAMVTGSVDGKSTISKMKCNLNTVLTCFSPISKEKSLVMPNDTNEIDILIATIMDLGLNEFRLDLLNYSKENTNIDLAPLGMHSIVNSNDEKFKSGVIYILKNINQEINIENRNQIHPFYMVHISDDEEIIINHLQPKQLLDTLRSLCKGVSKPIKELHEFFNDETEDGRKMGKYSELLQGSIGAIINVKEESDIDSFFGGGLTTALENNISGIDDFELICFLVVR